MECDVKNKRLIDLLITRYHFLTHANLIDVIFLLAFEKITYLAYERRGYWKACSTEGKQDTRKKRYFVPTPGAVFPGK